MRIIKKYNATDISNLYERVSKSESKLLKKKFAEKFCDVNSVNYKEYLSIKSLINEGFTKKSGALFRERPFHGRGETGRRAYGET
ncbi:hypothetical protein J2T15_002463 [Paenibacillus harenae]|uniref:Uncharacterized protein n=1 Tax=Paenibacillus harenae TaxID=306543 RepID=A0ABT9U0D2_PAEHA|nr:hypothetical protein [Paenibacillus harenae]